MVKFISMHSGCGYVFVTQWQFCIFLGWYGYEGYLLSLGGVCLYMVCNEYVASIRILFGVLVVTRLFFMF